MYFHPFIEDRLKTVWAILLLCVPFCLRVTGQTVEQTADRGLQTADTATRGRLQSTDSIAILDSVMTPAVRLPSAVRGLLWPEYPAFQDPPSVDSIIAGSLNVRLKSTSFYKNNEFKNNFIYGQTLVGLYFEPVLEYHPDRKTTIRAGVHLLKYYGRDSFDRKLPVISIRYDATEHFSLIFGTLYGTTNHGLIEPVQNFEDYLINNNENGIQLLWNYPNFRSDMWLNWEQFIKVADPFPEMFQAAMNSEFRLLDWKGLSLTAPFSMVFHHVGGEIDTYWGPGGTKLNLVHGLRLSQSFQKGFVKSIYGAQNFLEFIEVNPDDRITIPYGRGSYSRVGLDTRIGSFEAGYWKALNFSAPNGMPIFLSVSLKNPTYYQATREMLVLKYQFQRNLTDFLRIAFRFEPYYHFDTGRMDHSWSIYMVLDEGFFLANLKRKGGGG